jgi:hypothetical protein
MKAVLIPLLNERNADQSDPPTNQVTMKSQRTVRKCFKMSWHLLLLLSLGLLAGKLTPPAGAVIIVQAPNVPYVSFEAEAVDRVVPGTPTSWAPAAVPNSSGDRALYATGTASPGTSPHSFAIYKLRFVRPGVYFFYHRWKADAAYTAGDRFTANSSQLPRAFGVFTTPADIAPFAVSGSNGTEAPANNEFAWRLDGNLEGYEVTAEMVAAGAAVELTLGTREAGMVIDRIVLHTDNTLAGTALDPMPAESDIVAQTGADVYLAWEADTKANIKPGTPTSWDSLTVPDSSGGTALYGTGTASPGTSPHSFAQYQLKFTRAGTYYFYFRWKADAAYTAGDRFTANSSQLPREFGAFSTPADITPFAVSGSNGTEAPANNAFTWRLDGNTAGYDVTSDAVAAGAPIILTVGTREAGMVIDRIVLHPDNALTGPFLDGLLNSGAAPVAPEVASASGTAGLNGAVVAFTRALDPASVDASRFVIQGLAVTAATLDAGDSRRVNLATAAQTEGVSYTVTINGIKDTAGTPVAANTIARFTAWKVVAGWLRKETFFNVTGATVDLLKAAPNFPAAPDRVEFIRAFSTFNDPNVANYGTRILAFFTPKVPGVHDFFMANDDEAELMISDTGLEADLQSLGVLPFNTTSQVFDDAGRLSSGSLAAGRRYLLAGLVQNGGGDVFLHVGARPPGSQTPAAEVPVLADDQVSLLVDPALGVVDFVQQPVNTSAAAGTRARFTVKATAAAVPIYYQWRVNGADIPGATRNVYVTPTLAESDSGKVYSVVVSVAGADNPSANATLTVTPGTGSSEVPYIGANFVGGGGLASGVLSPTDVAGVVFQEKWNNVTGFTADNLVLADDRGAPTLVTLTFQGSQAWYSGGAATGDADGTLLEGYVNFNNSPDPLVFSLANVPSGTYSVLVYSVGFQFNATYEQSFALTGLSSYANYRVKAYTGLDYNRNPGFRRMSSTNPDQRDFGNYVRWDDVSPAADGSLVISVLPETLNPGNGHLPAVNAMQLVKTVPVTVRPTLGVTTQGGLARISWDALAIGFTLESTANLATGNFSAVVGVPNPITAAGSTAPPAGVDVLFYRLRKS